MGDLKRWGEEHCQLRKASCVLLKSLSLTFDLDQHGGEACQHLKQNEDVIHLVFKAASSVRAEKDWPARIRESCREVIAIIEDLLRPKPMENGQGRAGGRVTRFVRT